MNIGAREIGYLGNKLQLGSYGLTRAKMLLEKEPLLLRKRVKSKEEFIKQNGGRNGHSCKIGSVCHQGV